jgi:hypothetical protein
MLATYIMPVSQRAPQEERLEAEFYCPSSDSANLRATSESLSS